jgi:hypothetical protein
MPTPTTTVDQLKRAIAVAEQIEKLQAELAALLSGTSTAPAAPLKPAPAPAQAAPRGRRKKRELSPEARARIVAAVKARWARQKGQKVAASPSAKAVKGSKKRKRNLTPEGRARLAAAMKARWAARKAVAQRSK